MGQWLPYQSLSAPRGDKTANITSPCLLPSICSCCQNGEELMPTRGNDLLASLCCSCACRWLAGGGGQQQHIKLEHFALVNSQGGNSSEVPCYSREQLTESCWCARIYTRLGSVGAHINARLVTTQGWVNSGRRAAASKQAKPEIWKTTRKKSIW